MINSDIYYVRKGYKVIKPKQICVLTVGGGVDTSRKFVGSTGFVGYVHISERRCDEMSVLDKCSCHMLLPLQTHNDDITLSKTHRIGRGRTWLGCGGAGSDWRL